MMTQTFLQVPIHFGCCLCLQQLETTLLWFSKPSSLILQPWTSSLARSSFALIFPCIIYCGRKYQHLFLIIWPRYFCFLHLSYEEGFFSSFIFSALFVCYVSCPWHFDHSPVEPHFKRFQFFVLASVSHLSARQASCHRLSRLLHRTIIHRRHHMRCLIFVSRDMLSFLKMMLILLKTVLDFSMQHFISSVLSHCSFMTVPRWQYYFTLCPNLIDGVLSWWKSAKKR